MRGILRNIYFVRTVLQDPKKQPHSSTACHERALGDSPGAGPGGRSAARALRTPAPPIRRSLSDVHSMVEVRATERAFGVMGAFAGGDHPVSVGYRTGPPGHRFLQAGRSSRTGLIRRLRRPVSWRLSRRLRPGWAWPPAKTWPSAAVTGIPSGPACRTGFQWKLPSGPRTWPSLSGARWR